MYLYINISLISAPPMQFSDSPPWPYGLTRKLFFSSAPTSENLTHDIKIFPVRFGPTPAPYRSTGSVVYRRHSERAQESFPWDYMSTFLTNLPLRGLVGAVSRRSTRPGNTTFANTEKRVRSCLVSRWLLAFVTRCLFEHVVRNLRHMLSHLYYG